MVTAVRVSRVARIVGSAVAKLEANAAHLDDPEAMTVTLTLFVSEAGVVRGSKFTIEKTERP